MRQQKLRNSEAFEVVDAPQLADGRAVPQPAPAVPDMPKAAGALMIAAYAALMGAFVVTCHGARAGFAMLIAGFYLAMFFAIPAMFLGIERDRTRRPDLVQFLDRGIVTATGRIGGAEALVQMLIVPVLLSFGILAMGLAPLLD